MIGETGKNFLPVFFFHLTTRIDHAIVVLGEENKGFTFNQGDRYVRTCATIVRGPHPGYQ